VSGAVVVVVDPERVGPGERLVLPPYCWGAPWLCIVHDDDDAGRSGILSTNPTMERTR
jgi:hypothetical protein